MKSLFTAVRSLFHRPKPTLNAWHGTRSVWCASDTVQIGFTGVRPKLGRCAQELLNVITSPSAEGQLLGGLDDPDPRIVAYCLAGLEMLNSAALDSLPSGLLARTENVSLLTGSFLFDIRLNTFAEEVAKRRAEGQSLDRWLSYGHRISPESLPAFLSKFGLPTPDSPTSAPPG